jgi:hypothetical protein
MATIMATMDVGSCNLKRAERKPIKIPKNTLDQYSLSSRIIASNLGDFYGNINS